MGHNDKARDFAAPKGVQKPGIFLEGHASVRFAASTQHICVRKKARAAVHIAASDRVQVQRGNTVEELFPRHEIIGIGRRCSPHSLGDMPGIIEAVTEPGMGLQSLAVGQVDGVCLDVIEREVIAWAVQQG